MGIRKIVNNSDNNVTIRASTCADFVNLGPQQTYTNRELDIHFHTTTAEDHFVYIIIYSHPPVQWAFRKHAGDEDGLWAMPVVDGVCQFEQEQKVARHEDHTGFEINADATIRYFDSRLE